MPYITRSKSQKANPSSLFLLFVILGFTSLLLVVLLVGQGFQAKSFVPAPIVVAVAEAQNPPLSNPPVVRTIPAARVKTVVPSAVHQVPGARLIISKINVNAVIQEMGLTSEGAMAVPGNRVDVGWYSFGTRPGETGSAVIGGHNRWDGGVAVFDRLDQLEKGDVLSVVNAKGVSTTFVVRGMRTYDAKDPNTGIFESKSGIHLNLITCSGDFDPSTKTYTTRLVIFTDVVQPVKQIAAVPI